MATEYRNAHTPGPWTVEADSEGLYVLMGPIKGADEALVVYAAPFNEYDREPSYRRVADAHLIAAAPDMYAALEQIYEREGWVWVGEVLAKARGEQPSRGTEGEAERSRAGDPG